MDDIDGEWCFDSSNRSTKLVHDLPQIYTKPTVETLLETLALLSLELRDSEPQENLSSVTNGNSDIRGTLVGPSRNRGLNPIGIERYLSSIISSPLDWIPEEVLREYVWKQASIRISERAGRAARGPATRVLELPMNPGTDQNTVLGPNQILKLTYHEPTLTSDNLGFKTWVSSVLLARKMPFLRRLIPILTTDQSRSSHLSVLELGSGTGISGMAAAAMILATVYLTDLESIIPNLRRNVAMNSETIAREGGAVHVGVLDWNNPQLLQLVSWSDDSDLLGCPYNCESKFQIVLAADIIYIPEQPEIVCNTVLTWLERSPDSRVMIQLELRAGCMEYLEEFKSRLMASNLEIESEGEEDELDEWEKMVGLRYERVKCRSRWAVWRWKR